MPTLGVCGDSFLAATQDLDHRIDCKDSRGKHFTELLAKELNYEYFTLARGACSNTAIRLQIEQMLRREIDFLIVGTTSPARIEYPVRQGKFDPFRNIYNIIYDYHPDISSLDENFINPTIASDTISNILEGHAITKNTDQLESIKCYLLDIYCEEIKIMQDAWIIANGITAIKEAKIPYIILCNGNFDNLQISPFNKPDKRIITSSTNENMLPFSYDTYDEDTGNETARRYHTSDKNQVRIFKLLHEYIMSNKLLDYS